MVVFCLLFSLQGAACLLYLLSIPADPSNALLFGYSASRLTLAGILLGATLFFAWAAYALQQKPEAPPRLLEFLASTPTFALLLIGSLAGVLVCTTWPYAAPGWQAGLQRAFPLVLFATLVAIQTLVLSLALSGGKGRPRLALLGLLGVLCFAYIAATTHYSVVNREYWLSDQEALLQIARYLSADIHYTGTREFMPGFPLLAKFFMDARLEQAAFYAQGKLANIAFSLLFLAGIFFFVKTYFKFWGAILFTLLAAFTLFIYKAAYFQPELTYYFTSFLAFGLLLQIFRRPQPLPAVAAGLLLAASHYTKASILPTVALFSLAMLAQAAYLWLRRSDQASARRQLLILGLVLLAYLLPLAGYLKESKAVYGSYFYNVTTHYLVWFDSWGEAKASEQVFEYYRGVPDVPAEQLPSLQNYLKTHTFAQMLDRMLTGLVNQVGNWWNSYALVSFPMLLLAGLLYLAVRQREVVRNYMRQNPVLCVFLIAYFAAHFVLFAWYGPIADYSDRRFTYGQYLPLLFVTFIGYKALLPHEGQTRSWVPAFFIAILVLLAVHLLLYMPYQFLEFHWYGK